MTDPFAQPSWGIDKCSDCGGTGGGHYVSCLLMVVETTPDEKLCPKCFTVKSKSGACNCG